MDPIAIITGGSRGIGAATALLLAQQGWDIAISYRTESDAAARVVEEIVALGRRAIAVQADVGSEADILRLFETVDVELGTVRALINNAGIVAPKARVDEFTVERIEQLLRVNVTGTIVCAREAVRRMSTAHGGTGGYIVNVGSAAARIGSPGEYVDYAASKAAVDTFTMGLAKEVAQEGILVNEVRPGIVDTDIHASGGQPDRAERFRPMIPLQRPGRPEEIAAIIAFLCSPAASFMVGAIVDASGGR